MIVWHKNDRMELKYVTFMCLQLQEIGQPQLYMCGIFSKKIKFYGYFWSNGIFCLLEWTQLYFYLNEWQKQNCWYIFHYHLLNISWSYTHPIGVKYSILNQCFALVGTWSSEQAKSNKWKIIASRMTETNWILSMIFHVVISLPSHL